MEGGTGQEREGASVNKKDLLDRCARDGEERILLARVLDKLELTQQRDIPAHTVFLSPGEQGAVRDLRGRVPQDHHLAQVRPGQKDISLHLPGDAQAH